MSSMFSTVVRRMTASFDSSQQKSTSFTSQVLTDPKLIDIQDNIHSVRLIAHGAHVVTGGWKENIRQWQVANGKQVGKPMDAGNSVFNLAVSQDGKQIVCGTRNGQVKVWNATNNAKVIEFKAHQDEVHAVDISADGKRFATGSDDGTVSVWSFPTDRQLLGPLKHDTSVAAVKFSPGAKYLATASSSVRVYESHDGQLLADFPIRANSSHNESLAWTRAAKRLFALSRDGEIHCLDVSTKETLAKWRIHSDNEPKCIALACNDTVIIASAYSSLSLWDTTTHQQIGTVIYFPHNISLMAISPNYDIATAGNNAITLRDLSNILPDSYREDVRLERELRRLQIKKPNFYNVVMDIRARDARKKDDVVNKLEQNVQELHDQPSTSDVEKENLPHHPRSTTSQYEVDQLTETNKFLSADLDAKESSLGHLEQTIQDLRRQLTASRNALTTSDEDKESLIQSFHARDGRLSHLEQTVQDLHKQLTASRNALRAHDKNKCEATCAHGRIYDVIQPLSEIAHAMSKDLKPDKSIDHQLETLLTGVAKVALCCRSADDASGGGADKPPKLKFHVYRAVCDALESDDRVPEAIQCFRKMQHELSQETSVPDERSQWELDFLQRCIEKLEKEGDAAMESKNHDAAIGSYTIPYALHLTSTYIPNMSNIHFHPSMAALALPLNMSPFTLCTSGLAGFVGGDEAVLAMAAVHVYESRRWLGWYNSPGSYQIAKRLGLLAKSRILNGFSPGHTDLTKLVDLDITKGPKFRAAQSGTVIEDTGHVGSLVMKECAVQKLGQPFGERKTDVVYVTVIELKHTPDARMPCVKGINPSTPIFASIPIVVSLSCCALCVRSGDWCAFSLILLGILANGISSLIIGSGKLQFTHPNPAKGSPPGDGILLGSGKEIVLLKGEEGAVNSITRGSLFFSFSSEVELGRIEWCSALFTIQFLAQLLIIPHASQFGQIHFVASLGVSWAYNSWLASSDKDKDKTQRDILFNHVLRHHTLTKYTLGTFTSAVVFALLVLRPEEPIKFLDELLHNDTKVWKQWKETIARSLNKGKLEFSVSDWEAVNGFNGEDKKLLEKLYNDAQAVYSHYVEYTEF